MRLFLRPSIHRTFNSVVVGLLSVSSHVIIISPRTGGLNSATDDKLDVVALTFTDAWVGGVPYHHGRFVGEDEMMEKTQIDHRTRFGLTDPVFDGRVDLGAVG